MGPCRSRERRERIPPAMAGPPTAELVRDPYPLFAQLRHDAPVWQVPGASAFFVTTWDLVTEAAGRVEDFSNNFRHMLFTDEDGALGVVHLDDGLDVFAGADPPAHTDHRKLFFPQLVQTRMQGLEGVVTTLADELLGPILARGHGDAAA